MITACSGKVSHQPTFSDIEPDVNPLAKRTACNEEKAEALVETQQLTDHELEIIRATGQPRLIAGAAMQVPRGDDSGTALLRRALVLDPAIELLHIALIDRHFAKLFNEPIDSREEEALRGAIERFRHKAADNAFAQYLWAWQLLHDGRVSESIEALGAGNATSRFTSSSHERFLALIDAAQHVGHSRLVAFRSVLEFINPWNAYRALRELCKTLVTGPESSKARRQCYEAGGRIKAASRNNLEALVGLAIQRVASKASGWPKAPQWVARIDTRRDELFRLIDRLNALAPDLSEELWLRYIEVFAEQSEEAAIRFVTKDTERRK